MHSGWHEIVPIDADGNGIPDGWELRYVGTNVLANTDSDGDGATDRNEYRSGTNPTNAASVLRTEVADPLSPTGGLRIV